METNDLLTMPEDTARGDKHGLVEVPLNDGLVALADHWEAQAEQIVQEQINLLLADPLRLAKQMLTPEMNPVASSNASAAQRLAQQGTAYSLWQAAEQLRAALLPGQDSLQALADQWEATVRATMAANPGDLDNLDEPGSAALYHVGMAQGFRLAAEQLRDALKRVELEGIRP